MADLLTGKLTYKGDGKNRKRHLVFTTKKGKLWDQPIQPDLLAASLRANTDAEVEVAFETDTTSGRPYRIRLVGEEWKQTPPPQAPRRIEQRSRFESSKRDDRRDVPRDDRSSEGHEPPSRLPGDFHNPYNFIPAPPRKLDHADLGDQPPAGHDRFYENHWSGSIKVTLMTDTPLLIPDAALAKPNEKEKDHKHLPTRVGADGKPHLPPTSIKGMLRAAYEAVTNSRMGVFEGHENRLAFRMSTKAGLRLVPALIQGDEDSPEVKLCTGTSKMNDNGSPQQGHPTYAAWLPRYGSEKLCYLGASKLPKHGDKVEMWLEAFHHYRWTWSDGGRHVDSFFEYWRVRKLVPLGQILGDEPQATNDLGKENHLERSYHRPLGKPFERATGIVCITGSATGIGDETERNIDNKHDERVFFVNEKDEQLYPPIPIRKDQEGKAWRELITNYREIHETEIRQGQKAPPALNKSLWSRHITNAATERDLKPGALCFAQVVRDGNEWQVLGLYPVMIARELHEVSPAKLLDGSLHPAKLNLEKEQLRLSPADRTFGWVNQEGKGAYRGNIRITPAVCETEKDKALRSLGAHGLPLAILGQPKPQQVRFYLSSVADDDSLAFSDAGYTDAYTLRGRKVYPHHAKRPDGYWTGQAWDDSATDGTQENKDGLFREYLRPNAAVKAAGDKAKLNSARTAFITERGEGVRDKQNRSMQSWVEPNTIFTFDIHVTNLSSFELGALLWLLSLNIEQEKEPRFFHRLGGGKPFGFGSVHLLIDWNENVTKLRKGQGWKAYYSSLDDTEGLVSMTDKGEECISRFRQVIGEAYGGGDFSNAAFIKAFLKCAEGFNRPIHYPRTRPKGMTSDAPIPPHPEGKSFLWFVANERLPSDEPKSVLSELPTDEGLPYLDEPRQR